MIASQEFNRVIVKLASRRPLFHSEFDFQFELAWLLQGEYPSSKIRLEKPFQGARNSKIYLDIFMDNDAKKIGIELKYKTSKLKVNSSNESFDLSTHAATNLGRYDFLSDIERLEELKKNKSIDIGFAVFLSNDSSYWTDNSKTNVLGKSFYFADESTIKKGNHCWPLDVKESSIGKVRMNSLILMQDYRVDWLDYSQVSSSKFRFLQLTI